MVVQKVHEANICGYWPKRDVVSRPTRQVQALRSLLSRWPGSVSRRDPLVQSLVDSQEPETDCAPLPQHSPTNWWYVL